MYQIDYRLGSKNFYMILDDDLVIESGFGLSSKDLEELKTHRYLDYLADYFGGDSNALTKIKIKAQKTSDFSNKVYSVIAKIPYGQTMTYKQIAEKIGNPKAVQAVGTACGRNKLPLLIPCHRVIKSDGTLGNYAFGPKIKNYLLALEKPAHKM